MRPEGKDEQILALLFRNSRTSLRDIGSEVGLCASAVSARVNRLVASRGIVRFATCVNPVAFGFPGLVLLSFQDSEISKETRRAIRAVGKPLAQGETIGGETCLLKAVTIEEVTALSRIREAPDAIRVHEIGLKRDSVSRLSRTDLLIIRCLLSSPRAHVNEIARCASVTPKTVSHRLESLLRERVMVFRVEADASKTRLVEGYVFVELRDGASKSTLEGIGNALRRGMLYTSYLRYDGNMVVSYYCAGTAFDVAPVLNQIRSLTGVQHVRVHVFSRLTFFQDWAFEEIEARVGGLAKPVSSKV